jgi:hypothetical protein
MWMGKKRYSYFRQCTAFSGIEGEASIYGFGNATSSTFNGCITSSVATNTFSDIL